MNRIAALALVMVAPVTIAATQTAPVTPPTNFSNAELHDYARALVELQRVRSTAAARAGSLAAADRKVLAREEGAAMLMILRRHGLDVASFNAISGAVETRPDIRLEVKQAMMEDATGFDRS